MRQAESEVKKRVRALGGIGDAWVAVVPAALAARCEPVSLSRGVLTVRVADASARFELDRFLRAGGLSRLAARAGAAVKRAKLVT